LAAMLLPALAAAREKARRSTCANNLKQIAIGIASYHSDYNGYFMGIAQWEQRVEEWQRDKQGLYTQRTESVYESWGGRDLDHRRDMRCIGSGITDPSTRTETQLKVAPTGLGLLMTTGVLDEARSFYCPSARGAFEHVYGHTTYHGRAPSPTNNTHGGINANDILQDWADAGGFDAGTLTNGNWPRSSWHNTASTTIRGWPIYVFSQYNYRSQPGWVFSTHSSHGPGILNMTTSINWTRPRLSADMATPIFKTDKLLGGRAIVSDSFVKGVTPDPNRRPGFGIESHKDGYNALYGDHHTAWYGDPQQRLIWWQNPLYTGYNGWGLMTSDQYFERGWAPFWNGGAGGYYNLYGLLGGTLEHGTDNVPLIWHLMDMSAKIDEDTEAHDGVNNFHP